MPRTLHITAPLALTLIAGLAMGQNTARMNKSATNAVATTGSGTAFVNDSGTMAFFVSTAANLLPAGQDSNGVADVYCRSRSTNTVVRISVPDPSTGQAEANGPSSLCHSGARCTSLTGRFVVFTSEATNLVANDTNGVSDVFVRDRDLDGNGIFDEPGVGKTRTVRVSVSSNESQATGSCPNQTCTHYSYGGTISADGRFVAFVSGANLTAESVPYTNIYLRDRDADNDGIFDEAGGSPDAATTVLVSRRVCCAGTQFDGFSDQPAISGDGRFVAYRSKSDHIVFGDTNNAMDIFVYDRLTASNTRVSVSTGGDAGGSGDCAAPTIDGTGRRIAFETGRNGLVAGDTENVDIFLRDRDTDADGFFDEAGAVTTTLVSMGRSAFPIPSGSEVKLNGHSDSPAIDAFGTAIAFASHATNHTPGVVATDTNGVKDILVRNLLTNTTRRASVSAAGDEANGASGSPTMSYSGEFTGFSSAATNLDGVDGNGAVVDAYVNASVQRSADACPQGVVFPSGTYGFSTLGYYADGQSTCGNSNNSPDVMIEYVAECTGTVTIDTSNSAFDTVLSIHSACQGTLANQIACDDDGGAGLTSSITLSTQQGQSYFIRLTGFNRASGFGTLFIGECQEATCPADFNNDGGIDGGDVEAFYAAWEAGEDSSDVNHDGGIDGGDVEAFFAAWEAGGCF